MAEQRFLVVRTSSLGDIIHTLPAAACLRDSFPDARIDWLVDRKWRDLLHGNPDLNQVVEIDRADWSQLAGCVQQLRSASYTTALDFQGLYRSAILAFASGAPRRFGFDRNHAREGLASLLYNQPTAPQGAHKVDQNISLAEAAGAAKPRTVRFPLAACRQAEDWIAAKLQKFSLGDFFAFSPGGGWMSKCWPADCYGALHRELNHKYGWRGVVSFAPGERELADAAVRAAGSPEPVLLEMNLPQLMALLRRAKVFVAGDTGPLHLADALGTPVVGLFGPTDPARNGPYGAENVAVRNALPEATTYERGASHSATMMSITVAQVMTAVGRRLGRG
jgi:lipopolysaccharide heptosyltransferase I